MVGERERVRLTGALQPGAREPMSDGAIVIAQHGIGSLAQKTMAESEFLLRLEPGLVRSFDHFRRDEVRDVGVNSLGFSATATHQRCNAILPEGLAENACRAYDP